MWPPYSKSKSLQGNHRVHDAPQPRETAQPKVTGRTAMVVAVKALQRQRDRGQQLERHLKILHPKILVGGQSI